MARRTKASTVAAAATAQPPLTLPAELTIYTVGELHPQWLAWLQQAAPAAPAELQAAAVEQVDGAGLQLLLSLARDVAERGRALRIHEPSDVLRAGCDALGLGAWLQTHVQGAAA